MIMSYVIIGSMLSCGVLCVFRGTQEGFAPSFFGFGHEE